MMRRHCPRCAGALMINEYLEPVCLCCGWVDYGLVPLEIRETMAANGDGHQLFTERKPVLGERRRRGPRVAGVY